MKTKLVCSALFLLVVAIPAFSQQTLVKLDDDKNPCSRFKMVVLVPTDSNAPNKSVRKDDDSIDTKMVWNPCPQSTVSFAAIPNTPAPKDRFKFVFRESLR